jgi:hypothetical protein
MLTSFEVRCPHDGCKWSGSVIPKKDLQPWHGQDPSTAHPTVIFRCPRCQAEFRGQIFGDDVKIVPEALAVH